MKGLRFISLLILLVSASIEGYSKDFEDFTKNKENTRKVLVLGLRDNVNSNYFPDVMITEETGIPTDSIDVVYNKIIADNIAEASRRSGGPSFISSYKDVNTGSVISEIKLEGIDEECYADLSEVDKSQLAEMLSDADAEFLLILNQHYLKWQEQPMRTLFYFVSYSLFDKNKNEITRGNNYFTCMKPEDSDKLRKLSRKSSLKIASAVMKTLNNK